MCLFPTTMAKDQSSSRVDRLFGQLGAQQCPGEWICAVMSKQSIQDADDNLLGIVYIVQQ